MATDTLLEKLEIRHPIWESNIKTWMEIEDVIFDHVKDHPEKYIERGDDESMSDYSRRLRFARFKGEMAPILHRLVGAVMSRPPSRHKELSERWQYFIDNIDGCQTHLDQFLEDRLFEAFGYGATAILIDKMNVDSAGYSSEVTSMNFKPERIVRNIGDDELVAVPYRIHQIVDWSVDNYGEFHWVRCLEETTRAETPDVEAKKIQVYREFDRAGWRVFEVEEVDHQQAGISKEARLVDSGTHDLGIVPLAILYLQKEKPMSFYSPMRYAYHHDIAAFISDSDLHYASWRHAHPTIIDYSASDTVTRFTIGPGATIRRNPEYKEDAKYMDFPEKTTEQLRRNKEEAVDGMKRLCGIDPISGSSNRAAGLASGRSRSISFSISEERHLRRAARALSATENRIFEIAERWVSPDRNIPTTESLNAYRTNYPLVFSLAGTESLIEQWLATRPVINSDTYDRQMQIKIVDSALGDASRDVRGTILEEIASGELLGKQEELLEEEIPVALQNTNAEKQEPKSETPKADEGEDEEGKK